MDCGLAAGGYGHIWDLGFIERVKRRTEGQVQFEVTSFPELGVSGANSLRVIEDGALSAAQIHPPYIRGDHPIVDVSGLWGLHPNRATNLAVIDAVWPAMYELTAANGGVQVAYMMSGDYYLFSRKEVHDDPRDWQGFKVLSHDVVLSDLLEGMGAEPQYMAYSDVYSALERGAIDGAITCASCGYEQHWHEVADYIVGPALQPFPQLANRQPGALGHDAAGPAEHHPGGRCTSCLSQPLFPAGALRAGSGSEERCRGSEIRAAFLRNTGRDAPGRRQNVIPRWVDRAGGPYSQGLDRINALFNGYVYPIVNVYINPDGSASIEP